MDLLFKNVKMVDARKTKYGHLLVKNGYIEKMWGIEEEVDGSFVKEKNEVIDGKGLTLLPSFIDMHCHLRDPGFTQKEDLESGQWAALKGGFTTLCAMANTSPVCDNPETMEYIHDKAHKLNLCNIYQVSGLTEGLKGEEIVNIREMMRFTNLFSDDGYTIFKKEIMEEALSLSKEHGFLVMTHCQPESEIVKRDLDLLSIIGGNLHICHISLKKTLDIIKNYKKTGLDFTCEVTPHHLFGSDLSYRVNPPFRSNEDRKALVEGLKDGYIDVIGTDHAPHTEGDKSKGAPGISSIEVAFSQVYTIFQNNGLDLQLLSRVMSHNPAKILGLKAGLIEEGYKADLVLVDLDGIYKIKPELFRSREKNNPFGGRTVLGKVKMTVKEGRVLYKERDDKKG